MNQFSLPRALALSSWFVITLVFATFLLLGFYVIAGVDDLYVLKKAVDMGFTSANGFVYDTMTGRYVSNAAMTFCGIFYKDFFGLIVCDRFIPISITLLLPISIYAFIRTISLNKARPPQAIGFSLIFTLIYLTKTPTITEVLYWAASAATHTIGCILMLLLITCLIKQQLQPKKRYTFIALTLAILLGGVSESTLFATLIIVFWGILFIRVCLGQYNLTWIVTSLTLIICAYLVSFAHGNIARLIYSPNPVNFEAAVAYLSTATGYYLWGWIKNPLLILTSIFLFFTISPQVIEKIPFLKNLSSRILVLTLPTWLLITLFVPFLSAFLISAYYSRFWNIAYFVFLLGWFIHIALCRILLCNKNINITLPNWFHQVYLFIIAITLIFSVTVMRAGGDLLTKVNLYDEALYNRIRYLISTDKTIIEFEPLQVANLPHTIHRYDLTHSPDCYFNYQYAITFNKKAVYVKPLSATDCKYSSRILQYANSR